MDTFEESDARWSEYYQVASDRPVRTFYRQAVGRFQEPGFAIDLGCGAGIETLDLLRRGWRVLAVDKQADGLNRLRQRVPTSLRSNLETRVAPFEQADLPSADLIWAGLSLPFCSPEHFDAVWRRITSALAPDGRFAGDFFGPRHAWARSEGMTFLTRKQVETLADRHNLEYIQEGEGESQTALDGIQQWHMISIRMRKVRTSAT